MTKTTNYEISKKLAEIGFFRKEHNYYWVVYFNEIMPQTPKLELVENVKCNLKREQYPAYDLETLWDALPKTLHNKLELRIWCHENKAFIGYQNFNGFDESLTLEQQEDESLADTVGRMIILLHEKNFLKL